MTWIGLAPGEYRVKVYGEEWIDGIEEGSEQNPHTVTLYSYFTVAEPEPEPVPTYYNVVIPEVEGATTSPAAGTYTEEEGSYFSFTLTLKEGYEQSVPEVKANDAILTPDANGTYTILGIYEDITIAINGVVENTPTANAEVANPEVKVWFADNALHVYAPRKVVLWIYDLQGGLRYAKEEVVGEHTVSLSTGVYIVRVGDRRYKISL